MSPAPAEPCGDGWPLKPTCSCVTGMRRCLESSRSVFRSVLMSSLQPTSTILALGQNS